MISKDAIPNACAHHPDHYGGDTTYEAIKVIEAWKLGFSLGNAVKYICRLGVKPGTSRRRDLAKVAWYVLRELAKAEGVDPDQYNKALAKARLDAAF